MKTIENVHMRWMIRRDMEAVLSIERECFSSPWSEREFVRYLRQRNTIGMVAEYQDEVAGFMVYELQRNALDLVNIAVDPWYQRQGVGSLMVNKLKGKLSKDRRVLMLTKVRESNLAAQLFFRASGFECFDVVRDAYEEITEDAYLFQYRWNR